MQKLQSENRLDRQIADIIHRAGLTSDTNEFFARSKSREPVRSAAGLFIAYHWREITKGFMFSTIAGLGAMADIARTQANPSVGLLKTIQTGFQVIGDDLNNVLEDFRDAAPKGIAGIHYVWWHDTVLKPILKASGLGADDSHMVMSENAKKLLAHMAEVSGSPIGSAAQLRVVEVIALDVALSFRRVFGRVAVNGVRVFPNKEDLVWMNAHIKAEVAHSQQVSDEESGMASIADTLERQREMLDCTQRSALCWQGLLRDFAAALDG